MSVGESLETSADSDVEDSGSVESTCSKKGVTVDGGDIEEAEVGVVGNERMWEPGRTIEEVIGA